MKRILILIMFVLCACGKISSTPINSPQIIPAGVEQESIPDLLANLQKPDCTSGLTPSDVEGPYYKANTPERTSLYEEGMQGKKLILLGFVTNIDCFPMPGVWLDFWQANAKGEYDNEGYTLRGHQFSDNKGRYYIETIMPGLYPQRPIEHIHVKLQAPNGEMFTAQLYFPDKPIVGLTVDLQDQGDYYLGIFNFVIP